MTFLVSLKSLGSQTFITEELQIFVRSIDVIIDKIK